MNFQVSMGIYVMEPEILDYIPHGVPFGFDDLVLNMLDKRDLVNTFTHDGMWMDIGRPEDFHKAQLMFEENGNTILGV